MNKLVNSNTSKLDTPNNVVQSKVLSRLKQELSFVSGYKNTDLQLN